MKPLEASRSLRARLTVTYVVALTLGLVIFAAFSLTVIEQVLISTLDARLATSARAFLASLSVEDGRVDVDYTMRRRLRSILSPLQNGAIVQRGGTVLMQSGAIPPEVVRIATAVPADGGYAGVRADGTPLRILVAAVPDAPDTIVVLWRPIDFITDYRRTGLIVFGATILAIVLTVFGIGSLIAGRGLKPLRQLADVAAEIEARDLSRRLTTPMRDREIAQLCAAFNRMLDRLEFAFEQQRRFTADASHELRGPLAVIRAEVDLSLRRTRSAQSYREAMSSIQAEIVHLEALIDTLMMIARAEAGFFEAQDVDVSILALRAADRMMRFAAAKGGAIRSEIADGSIAAVDPVQFERILVALLHNAIKFGRENGVIELTVQREGGDVVVVIRDDGAGFSEEEQSHAFDRFWCGSSECGGSGLGLTIAKAAIERWNGRIRIANATRGGGEISIRLPAQRSAVRL